MNRLVNGSTIGILGGGQLGRMLCSSAAKLGYKTIILDPDSTAPASQLSNEHIVSNYDNESALSDMASQCDVITYEFENVPLSSVEFLQSKLSVFPAPEALRVAQDRLVEKEFLQNLGFTLSPFCAVSSQSDLDSAHSKLGKGILKSTMFGYDGKGQYLIDGDTNIGIEFSHPFVFEQFQNFDYEFSLISVRSHSGDIIFFDTARNVHKQGILATSTVPADVPDALENQARDQVKKLLESLDYVGVLSVEFFCVNNEPIVNEIAPRVHNSGHWTEVCINSQFDQHIRAICGLPLGSVARSDNCQMINLIGEDINSLEDYLSDSNATITLYGKGDIRAGRKMGHIVRRLK